MPSSQSAPQRRVERPMKISTGRPMDTYDQTRQCRHPECTALLSRYNPNETCAVHGGWADEQKRRSA
jgi:hypothetical protein